MIPAERGLGPEYDINDTNRRHAFTTTMRASVPGSFAVAFMRGSTAIVRTKWPI